MASDLSGGQRNPKFQQSEPEEPRTPWLVWDYQKWAFSRFSLILPSLQERTYKQRLEEWVRRSSRLMMHFANLYEFFIVAVIYM